MKKTAIDELRKHKPNADAGLIQSYRTDDILQAMQAYADQQVKEATEWISVDDRLPNSYIRVLVLVERKKEKSVSTGHYMICNGYGAEVRSFNIKNVVAWQPFPQPPTN